MMDRNQRESYLTIAGLVAIIVAFYLVIQRPAQSASKALQAEIALEQRELSEMPLRLAEVQALKADLARCSEYVDRAKPLMLSGPSLHTVIREVADFAGRHRLNLSRLEPLAPQEHETYQEVPFHIQFHGPFFGVMQLISEMEQSEHLFVIKEFTISRDIRRDDSLVQAEMHFSVYVGYADVNGSAEIRSSTGLAIVDSNR